MSGASGPLWRVDHWLGRELRKRAEMGSFVRSYWSTLESGPLARPETGEKGRNGELCHELVVHFGEWTTGWVGNWGKGQKSGDLSGASGPLAKPGIGEKVRNRGFVRS